MLEASGRSDDGRRIVHAHAGFLINKHHFFCQAYSTNRSWFPRLAGIWLVWQYAAAEETRSQPLADMFFGLFKRKYEIFREDS